MSLRRTPSTIGRLSLSASPDGHSSTSRATCFGIADGELDRHLAAHAVGDQVIRRRLHVLGQVDPQLLDQVVDGDRHALGDAAMQGVAFVDDQVGHVHVEIAAPGGDVEKPRLRLLGQAVDQDRAALGVRRVEFASAAASDAKVQPSIESPP